MSGDRTSTVLADETWRPARLSGWLAATVTVGVVLWAASTRGLERPALAGLAAGTVAAAAAVVAAGDRPGHALAGSLLTTAAAAGYVGALAYGASVLPYELLSPPVLPEDTFYALPTGPLVVLCAFVAAFGVALGLRDALDARTTGRATVQLLYVLGPVVAAAGVVWGTLLVPPEELLAVLTEGVAEFVTELLAAPPDAGLPPDGRRNVDVVAPGGLALVAVLSVAAALVVDPLARYDAERLPRYRRWRPRALAVSPVVATVLAAVLVPALALGPDGTADLLRELPGPLAAVVVAVADPSALRVALLSTTVLAGTVAAGTLLARRAARFDRWTAARVVGRLSGGVALVAATVVAFDAVDAQELLREWLADNPERAAAVEEQAPELLATLLGEEGPELLFAFGNAAVLGAVLLWGSALSGLFVALRTRVLPQRAGGFAVAAACTFVLAAAVAFAGAGPFVLVVGVALAFVVWDLGEFAVGVGEEVGRAAWTTHGELVHTGAAFGLGAVAVGASLALSRATGSVTAEELGGLVVVGLVGSLLALALLLAAART